MPIRSPRGRAAAYRAIWQWPLRSPARLAVTVVAAVAVAVGVGLASAALAPPQSALLTDRPSFPDRSVPSGPRTSGLPGQAVAPTPTVLPPVPELEPDTLPLSQAPAVAIEVAARWSAAWLRPPPGTTGEQWRENLRATTTEEYLGVLSNVDPANIPATRLTGEPRPVRVAARSVQVEVPTDALTLLVLVVDTETGWRVAGYDRA